MTAALLLLLGVVAAVGPEARPCAGVADAVGFGDWLAERGDYYRAIGEYQRAAYLGAGSCAQDAVTLRIARAYALGEQGEEATRLGRGLSRDGASEAVRLEGALVLAYARLRAGDLESAVSLARALRRGGTPIDVARRGRIVEALALLRAEGREREAVDAAAPLGEDPDLSALADRVRGAAASIERAPRKSPLLAGALSAALPGLGQLYLGEPGPAAAALAVNAVFAWATVDAFRARRYGLAAAALVVESLWYGGAIFGAVAGAHRHNRDVRALAADGMEASLRIERDVLPLPPAVVFTAGGSF